MKGIITITGPSCSGKTTLVRALMRKHPDLFAEIVSHTTRKPRDGEVEGVDYFYVTEDEFETVPMVESIEFNGIRYGGSVAEFDRCFAEGKVPLIVVEPTGAAQIRDHAANASGWFHVAFYLSGPVETLMERFMDRENYDLDEYAERRFKSLIKEHTEWPKAMAGWSNAFQYGYIEGKEEFVEDIVINTAKKMHEDRQ